MSKNSILVTASAAAAIAVLFADYHAPLGVAIGTLYVFVILTISFSRKPQYVFFFAYVVTVFSVLGYFLSPPTADAWKAVLNRTMSVLSIWAVVLLILKLLKTLDAAESLNLEQRNQKNTLERSRRATLSLLEDADLAKYQAVRAKNHAEHIIESAPNGMIIVDNTGKIVDANTFTFSLLDYSEQELVGQPFERLIPERFREGLFSNGDNKVKNLNYSSAGTKQEIHCLNREGVEIPVELGLNPVIMEEDSYLLATIVDISGIKKAEQELRFANSQLKLVNRELSNFAYITSHDLQEPLRSIASFLQLLKSEYGGDLDESANEYIDFSVDGATRLQGMIRSLLHYSRIDSREIEFEKIDLRESVQSAKENLYKLIIDTKTELVVSDLPEIYGDSAQITQLFQNLMANSIKFRSKETPRISISSKTVSGAELQVPGPPDFEYCVVTFTDNGIGINPDYHSRIFNIFQRLHPGNAYPGHGIGLALCNKIVNLHGGTIWLESEEGKGSSFSFSLLIQRPAREN